MPGRTQTAVRASSGAANPGSCVEVAGDQSVAHLSWSRLGSMQAVVAHVRRSLVPSAPLRRTIEGGRSGKKKAYHPKARPSVLLVITWMRRVLIEPPDVVTVLLAWQVPEARSCLTLPSTSLPELFLLGDSRSLTAMNAPCPIDPGGAHASHYVSRDCRKEAGRSWPGREAPQVPHQGCRRLAFCR